MQGKFRVSVKGKTRGLFQFQEFRFWFSCGLVISQTGVTWIARLVCPEGHTTGRRDTGVQRKVSCRRWRSILTDVRDCFA
jgi:DNA-directed RNA polymerase subunit N (RpoN/RPB10)